MTRIGSEPRRGVTLLEALIAVTIVVIVVVAILQLFDQDVEVQRQQDQMAEMQQNLRAAMDLIARDVRSASACASIPTLFKGGGVSGNLPFSVPVPIALAWMPSEGPLASTATLAAGDSTRPDGIAVMRCIGTGIVDVEPSPDFDDANGSAQFLQPMGLQESDIGKFLLFWTGVDSEARSDSAAMPHYITAQILDIDPPANSRSDVTAEEVTLGPRILPTNIPLYSTFGQHWEPLGLGGTIQNFDPDDPDAPTTGWKAALVEWVEYTIDKWPDNDIPHTYSASINEGSTKHPLLIRRVNPHKPAGSSVTVPEWDVIAHDIENLQVVWMWDPDGDPTTPNVEPATNLEYQAGDPSKDQSVLPECNGMECGSASFVTPYAGFPNLGINGIWTLIPGQKIYPNDPAQAGVRSPVCLRKVRITLLARTRDRDLRLGDGPSGNSFGYPEIERGVAWLQGSGAIPGGAPAPPLYLSGYRRRALTSELTIRNYLPGGLE